MHIKKYQKFSRFLIVTAFSFILASITIIFLYWQSELFTKAQETKPYQQIINSYDQKVPKVHIKRTPSITFVFTPFSNSTSYLKSLFNVTVRSWLNAFPKSQLFLFGNDIKPKTFEKILSPYTKNVEFISSIAEDDVGLLYVDDIFIKSVERAKTDLICFIMQDTVLPSEINKKVSFLYNYYASKNHCQFGVIGRRCVISWPPPGNESFDIFSAKLFEYDALRTINSIQNSMYSNEFILFSLKNSALDFSDIPPFHFGMNEWDSWIPGWMSQHIPVVSLGDECAAYHIQHSKKINFLVKLAENYEIAQMLRNQQENIIYKDLQLKIADHILYKGLEPIAELEN